MLRAVSCGQNRRRRGHDPLCLAGQFEGSERWRDALLGDAPEQRTELSEEIHAGRSCNPGKPTNSKECQQQAPADAKPLKHRSSPFALQVVFDCPAFFGCCKTMSMITLTLSSL